MNDDIIRAARAQGDAEAKRLRDENERLRKELRSAAYSLIGRLQIIERVLDEEIR